MIQFDFKTHISPFVSEEKFNYYQKKKSFVFQQLETSYMNGWMQPDVSFVSDIYPLVDEVKATSSCLVVIGIGGSFLGSCAISEMFQPYFQKSSFPIIYAGTSLSSQYMSELLTYLETVDFSVNVISKSGTTMETFLTYQAIKEVMKRKYSKEEMQKRIIVVTDATKGALREDVEREGYRSFVIPDTIGGRYSLLTPAHLFPLAFHINISEFILGYQEGMKYQEEAYLYAVVRRVLFDHNKVVENYVSYEENWSYYMEWLKQLFGETEGKEGKGIFPAATIHTRDLHSLGQFVQEGNKLLFETFFQINKSRDFLIDGKSLHQINQLVEESVLSAHVKGDVPCNVITIDKVDERTMGQLSFFFLLSASYSGFLFDVDPFNQPGVEVYKSEVRDKLEEQV